MRLLGSYWTDEGDRVAFLLGYDDGSIVLRVATATVGPDPNDPRSLNYRASHVDFTLSARDVEELIKKLTKSRGEDGDRRTSEAHA